MTRYDENTRTNKWVNPWIGSDIIYIDYVIEI